MAIIKLESTAEQKPYILSNGKAIISEDESRKMEIIASCKPEINKLTEGVGYSWDEAGFAQIFAQCYEQDTKYCPEAKSWYTYSDGAWRLDTGSLLVSQKIKEFYQLLHLYCGEIKDMDRRDRFTKFTLKLGDRRFRDRLLKDAADDERLIISLSRFDSNPYLINCRNGTFDLNTMTFREHDWRDYLTMQTAFDYTVKDVVFPRWEQFIDEVTQGDKEIAKYIQTALGYSMLGIACEECMFILHGKTTRNGKSTLLNAIEHLLGDYASVAPVSIICKQGNKDAEAASPVLAALKGRRFVTMSESNQYGKMDEETLKLLTGGEEITTRALYQTPTTWLPQFTLWLSCNDLPAVNDRSLFASERLKVIEFNRHFSAEEQDKSLKTLFSSQEAMQGIFSWMIKGYFHYKRFGLKMPEQMVEVVRNYQRDNDYVLMFLEEKCEGNCGEDTEKRVLYDAYRMWCKCNNYYAFSAKRFYAELDTHPEWHGGQITEDGRSVYKNLKLR